MIISADDTGKGEKRKERPCFDLTFYLGSDLRNYVQINRKIWIQSEGKKGKNMDPSSSWKFMSETERGFQRRWLAEKATFYRKRGMCLGCFCGVLSLSHIPASGLGFNTYIWRGRARALDCSFFVLCFATWDAFRVSIWTQGLRISADYNGERLLLFWCGASIVGTLWFYWSHKCSG